jgi:hypothetical protein
VVCRALMADLSGLVLGLHDIGQDVILCDVLLGGHMSMLSFTHMWLDVPAVSALGAFGSLGHGLRSLIDLSMVSRVRGAI